MAAIVPFIPLIVAGIKAAGDAKSESDKSKVDQQRLALDTGVLGQRAAVDTANFNRQNPSVQMGNASRGDLLANVQPAKFSGSGRDLSVSGGLSPSLLSEGTRQLGANVSRQALLANLGKFDPTVENIDNPYAPPTIPQIDPVTGKPIENILKRFQDSVAARNT